MKGKHYFQVIIAGYLLLFIVLALPVAASADAQSGKLLDKMFNARHPRGLSGFTCRAEMETTIEGDESNALSALAILDMPTIGMDITYVAPFDFRVSIENSPIPTEDSLESIRLRGDDPLTLANPALKQALLAVYDVEYIGYAVYYGDDCDVIRLTPLDETEFRPPFELYLCQPDCLPVYTEMTLLLNGEEIEFRSDIMYETYDGFRLPWLIQTRANLEGGVLLKMDTTFSDYNVNSVTLIESEKKEQATGDVFQFSDIYHGFEDPEMMVNLSEDSKPYSKLRFAFALEVSSDDVAKELDKLHPEIVDSVRAALEGRKWADLDSLKYETGLELTKLINGMLSDGTVTDFYFTIFHAER